MNKEEYVKVRKEGDMSAAYQYYYEVYIEGLKGRISLPPQLFAFQLREWLSMNGLTIWSLLDKYFGLNIVTSLQTGEVLHIYV